MLRRDAASAPGVPTSGSRLPRLVLAGALAVATTQACLAQPTRRSTHKSQPAPISRTAPDTTATIPSSKPNGLPAAGRPASPPIATQDYGEGLAKPFDLPVAPRARMRSCGEKWQAVKMSGHAGSDTWREFAAKCLIERTDTQASH